MESALDYHAAAAALDWLVELGADEAIGEAPVDRYDLPQSAPKAKQPAATPQAVAQEQVAQRVRAADVPAVDTVGEARHLAEAAQDLDALKAAMASYEHCELKRGARQLVFADGIAGAKLMIVGEAPGRDEDREGKPFVGRAGQLLDRMLLAIGMGRAKAEAPVYITNVMPWRPPQNRDPKPEEIAMMLPFLERHVALANPDIVVLMGNISCQAVLGRRGITRLRGNWVEAFGRPALPMFHPAYLLRTPSAKRETWADLLSVKARLGT
ncbi:uracil-DNA glycosylase [Alisedimentitalea sp. MJ-SS2]|uniref:uracil-DNA glycosylase n=1 Tax=Aliisedimentitalea sp. MJ-SS2 TaxID=3049795 RepID=UPI00290B325E|nr:uracil-DNA glycosylase [Alisedimentitalea sp. MJ-SS2]MDU8928494.1 uracil-DNA glycosylase [Alisedimentitalea sp. MJ-SS2]